MSTQDPDLPAKGALGRADGEGCSHPPGAGPPTTGSIPIALESYAAPKPNVGSTYKPNGGSSAADFPRDSLSEDLLPASCGLGIRYIGDDCFVL